MLPPYYEQLYFQFLTLSSLKVGPGSRLKTKDYGVTKQTNDSRQSRVQNEEILCFKVLEVLFGGLELETSLVE
jgi:hypothetical protein